MIINRCKTFHACHKQNNHNILFTTVRLHMKSSCVFMFLGGDLVSVLCPQQHSNTPAWPLVFYNYCCFSFFFFNSEERLWLTLFSCWGPSFSLLESWFMTKILLHFSYIAKIWMPVMKLKTVFVNNDCTICSLSIYVSWFRRRHCHGHVGNRWAYHYMQHPENHVTCKRSNNFNY